MTPFVGKHQPLGAGCLIVTGTTACSFSHPVVGIGYAAQAHRQKLKFIGCVAANASLLSALDGQVLTMGLLLYVL
jgi:hypothetical protein